MGGSGWNRDSVSFTGKTTEEAQKHFTEIRIKERAKRLKRARRKPVDIDEQFKSILVVMEREIEKLLDLSRETDPLDPKNHEAVIAYAKLISALKKQFAKELEEMTPEELEKLANGS